jgi:chaperonin GroES
MELTATNKLKNVIIVGDKVLVKPKQKNDQTKSGLYLPPTVQDNQKVYTGYVVKAGPGYPIPSPFDEDEPWKEREEQVKYIPLQAKEGDLAMFLQKASYEVTYEGEKYFIVPQSAILMLERLDDLFE